MQKALLHPKSRVLLHLSCNCRRCSKTIAQDCADDGRRNLRTRRSDTCNLLRASVGVLGLWEQTNRAGCERESLRVLVSCFDRFFISFEMHLTRSLDSNLFAAAGALSAIIIGGQKTIRSWRAESLIDQLYPEGAIECAILNRFAHMLRRDLSLAIEIGDGARNFQNSIVRAGA